MVAIVQTDDVLGGKARLEGRRISVFQIGEMYTEAGESPEYIADQLDLTLTDVHAALAYYYDHPEEMAEIRRRRADRERDLKEHSHAPKSVEQ